MFDEDIIIPEIEDGSAQYEHFRCVVDAGQVPVRIDKYLFERMVHSSRNRIQSAAEAGYIQVGGSPVKSNYKVRPGDVITHLNNQASKSSQHFAQVARDLPKNRSVSMRVLRSAARTSDVLPQP